MPLTFYTDPGHGWLRVPLEELAGFEPSPYSYRDARYAYLEEDCDAPGWIRHTGRSDDGFRSSHRNSNSPIRQLERFPDLEPLRELADALERR